MGKRTQVVCPQGDGLSGKQEWAGSQPILLPCRNGEDIPASAGVGKLDARQMEIVADCENSLKSEFLAQRNCASDGTIRAPAVFVNENALRRNAVVDRKSPHGLRLVNVPATRPSGHHEKPHESLLVKLDTRPYSVLKRRRQSAIRINTATKNDRRISLPSIVRLPKAVNLQQGKTDAAADGDECDYELPSLSCDCAV